MTDADSSTSGKREVSKILTLINHGNGASSMQPSGYRRAPKAICSWLYLNFLLSTEAILKKNLTWIQQFQRQSINFVNGYLYTNFIQHA